MKPDIIATSLYTLLLFLGGMIGFATAHSVASLVMGTLFSVLFALSAWGMFKNMAYAKYSALILSAVMLVFFSYRFLGQYKFFPAGMMALLSLGLLLFLLRSSKKAVSVK